MTSLICWFAVDSRAIASLYIASDSRITATDGRVLSDTARKVFACRKRPDIFGYCGNADAPPRVLAEWISALDSRTVAGDETGWHRAQFLVERLNHALPLRDGHLYGQTKVVYASRDGDGYTKAAFAVFEISVVNGRWDYRTLDHSKATKEKEDPDELTRLDVVFAEGTGARAVQDWRERWKQYHSSEVARLELGGTTRASTSRGVFSALCSALRFANDLRSGGAPQLAVIHQERAARSLGVIWNNQRFFEGRPQLESEAVALDTKWHDKLFQRCDPTTMQALEEAAIHSAPIKGLDPERPTEAPSKRKERRQKAAARSVVERDKAREAHRKRFLK